MGAPQLIEPAEKASRLRARIERDSLAVDTRVELAAIHVASNRAREALAESEEALSRAPANPTARLLAAVAHLDLGNAAAAAEQLDIVLAGDVAHREALRAGAAEFQSLFTPGKSRAFTLALVGMHPAEGASYHLHRTSYLRAAGNLLRAGDVSGAEALTAAAAAIPTAPVDEAYYGSMALVAQARGDRVAFLDFLAKADALRPPDGNPVTALNYRRLRDLLQERGIRLVAVQYPLRPLEVVERMLEHDPNVVFVGNEQLFKDVLATAPYSEYFIDAFAGDFGHLTPKGNRLLAENVARAVQKEIIGVPLSEDASSSMSPVP